MNYYVENPDLREYFLDLPKGVRERLVESGVEISTLGELMQCAAHIMEEMDLNPRLPKTTT